MERTDYGFAIIKINMINNHNQLISYDYDAGKTGVWDAALEH